MTDPPGYTRFLQNQRRLSTPIAATEGLPKAGCIVIFRNPGAQPVRGRHRASFDAVQIDNNSENRFGSSPR
jgi:hypothetical protein